MTGEISRENELAGVQRGVIIADLTAAHDAYNAQFLRDVIGEKASRPPIVSMGGPLLSRRLCVSFCFS
jgi:hypothetical protein